jgi:prophage antirepressor-like protein
MNELQIFENPEFGRVRTTVIDGEPWFVAADVCHALDIGNPSDALNRLDSDERTLVSIEGLPSVIATAAYLNHSIAQDQHLESG